MTAVVGTPPISAAKRALAAAFAGGDRSVLTGATYDVAAEAIAEFINEWYRPALVSVRRAGGVLEGLAEELQARVDRGEAPAARTLEWLIERHAAVLAGVPTLVDGYPAQRLFEKLRRRRHLREVGMKGVLKNKVPTGEVVAAPCHYCCYCAAQCRRVKKPLRRRYSAWPAWGHGNTWKLGEGHSDAWRGL
jgi:hypothetical protein